MFLLNYSLPLLFCAVVGFRVAVLACSTKREVRTDERARKVKKDRANTGVFLCFAERDSGSRRRKEEKEIRRPPWVREGSIRRRYPSSSFHSVKCIHQPLGYERWADNKLVGW
ncbi:hypothetical protein ABKV19_026700 [Rosa sericea]